MHLADYERVEMAIRYIETRVTAQPDLERLARHVGLSPHHFQRLFARWAGVSPKRFLQFLTVEHAKALLGRSDTVLEAAYGSGLSGSSRLHDLFVVAEAVTPGEFRQRGAGLQIRYGIHPSPFGACLLGTTDRGICALRFLGQVGHPQALAELTDDWPRAVLREDRAATGRVVRQIFDRAATGPDMPPLRLWLKGTNFQLKVWQALLRIPDAAAVSYEDVARFIGHPKAVRAVGSAVGANPVAYLIPCHRVLRKTAAFGDYRWGAARKKAILGWEAAARSEAEHGWRSTPPE